MSLVEILSILFIHWFADFVLQTDKQAKGKSKNWNDLLMHTANYSVFWLLIGVLIFPIEKQLNVFYFVLITFICHTATDYFTSRLNSRLYQENKIHEFFVSIGFDQYLHYIQLFTTYYILFK